MKQGEVYDVLVELGGVAPSTAMSSELDRRGFFDGKTDDEKLDEWRAWQTALAVSKEKTVYTEDGNKCPSILSYFDPDMGKVFMAITEQTLDQHGDKIKALLFEAEKKNRKRSVKSRGLSYAYKEMQGVLFEDLKPAETLSGSPPEEDIWRCLEPMGLGLVQQYQAGQFRVDLAQVEKKLLFEIDSYEYHFKAKQQYEKTALRDHYLLENYEVDGWDLKHLHACQIMFDPDKIANQVKQVVLNR